MLCQQALCQRFCIDENRNSSNKMTNVFEESTWEEEETLHGDDANLFEVVI